MPMDTPPQEVGPATAAPVNHARSFTPPVAAGIASWMAIALGFLGLKMLMEERPQFTGLPIRFSKTELVQDSPQVVFRKVTDDIAVIKPAQPESSMIHFDMNGRRDHRGLRTVIDMSGGFRAQYVLTNAFEEPIFVLFKSPRPRTDARDNSGLLASGLRLQCSVPGVQENTDEAWFWSGTLAAHSSAAIELAYQVSSLKAVTYRIRDQSGSAVKLLRVSFQRKDLASMAFETGDGSLPAPADSVVWERKDFLAPDFFSARIVESRNLYASLSQLLEIGPVVCLLFLVAAMAVILARQRMTVIQVLTISAGFALYFPLILYLSSRFSFPLALVMAVVIPGALLVNYARWLLGIRIGLLGGVTFLALYQVFPTLAAFAGWNRGMVLLGLGVVTLWVLINLQNRALKQQAVTAGVLAMLALPTSGRAAEIQVTLPAELAGSLWEAKREETLPLVSFEPARYVVRQDTNCFEVEVTVPVQCLRAGTQPVPLFAIPVYLRRSQLDLPEQGVARIVTVTNQLGLYVQKPGQATLQLACRAPIETREGKRRAQIPLVLGSSGSVRLESARPDLEVLQGSLWAKTQTNRTTVYDIGVAGASALVVEWRELDGESPLGGKPPAGVKEFYGIGITRAQHLTVINSDGSCAHFAELELPVLQAEEFTMRLPNEARLISVSVNGVEIGAPAVVDQICRIRLPDREAGQSAHRLSFRIAYPQVRLGFVGLVEPTLPQVFQTVGTLEWVVALPSGFTTQVISSGLEAQTTQPDLGRFGDYGRILKSQTLTALAKNLTPPGLISLSLKYRQNVRAMSEPHRE